MIYVFYFGDEGAPKTGLSPTLDIFVKESDGTSAGTPPTPSELSGGFYKFTYVPTYNVVIRIDSNDATMADADRYIPLVASPHDDDLDRAVSTVYDRIGAPAGASIAADLVVIDNFVDNLETICNAIDGTTNDISCYCQTFIGRLTAARAGYLDELAAANLPADIAAVPSDVWDEILTGATHNIATSAGRRVREIGAYAIHSGTAQAGNSHSITLAASDTVGDNIYNRNLIVLVDNTGVGQTRTITGYDSATKVAVIDRDWYVQPDATTVYQITAADTPLVVDHGVAQGGTATTITLRAVASATNDNYKGGIVTILAGTGRGQIRLVDSYNGATKVITICGDDWVTTPDTTSVYVVMPYGVSSTACITSDVVAAIADGVWDEAQADHVAAGSFGEAVTDLLNESNGRWRITENQMIFYEGDNITEVMRFNLFDADGNPAMQNVYERRRV